MNDGFWPIADLPGGAELGEHCGGPKIDGNYVHSLVLTDTPVVGPECLAIPVRNQLLVVQGMTPVAADLPFAMLGVDTDSDSAFMNDTVYRYCKTLGLEQTRSRASKKMISKRSTIHLLAAVAAGRQTWRIESIRGGHDGDDSKRKGFLGAAGQRAAIVGADVEGLRSRP